MSRLVASRWFLPGSVIALVLAGLGLSFSGDPALRTTGLVTLLIFGVGVGSVAVAEAIAPPTPKPRKDAVDLPDGTTVPALILPFRQLNGALLVTSAVGLAAGSALFALSPSGEGIFQSIPAHVVMGLCAIAFAIAAVVQILTRPKSAGSIAMTGPSLIISWPMARASIPWRAIASVSRGDQFGSPRLKIDVTSPKLVTWSRPADWLGALDNILRLGRIGPVALRQIGLPPDTVVTLANEFLDQARRASSDTAGLGLPAGTEALVPTASGSSN